MQAYHGVNGAQHQANFDRLFSQGYRMISLSVYGEPTAPIYAAVWVQRTGSAWVAVHGVNSAGYQSFFDNWTARGFVPVIVSATGASNNAIFAAMFEQGISGPWLARHGLTTGPDTNTGTFQQQNAAARAAKMILRSVTIYGTVSDRRYAAIWHANPGFTKWHVHPSDTATSYQTVFNAETQLPSYRPAYVTLDGEQLYCSVFKDDVVGPWVARHGLTSDGYQAEFDRLTPTGYYPICVQGGGSGASTRYAAIFAKRDIPLPREWTVTGVAVPSLAGFDHVMQTFMQANAVRAAQLTIAKNGVVKFARAYTWAESGFHITQPSDRFLLASCSKMFVEAAVQSLYDATPAKLTPTTAVYPLLGFSHPLDPRSDSITIQQLLDHQGGYDDTSTGSRFDPTYAMRQIALDQHLSAIDKLDVARYMYARMLDFAPGTNSKYSNFGYLAASAVVEKMTGMKYFDYLNAKLLQPANITDVEVWPTVASPRPTQEVIQEDEGLGLSAVNVTSPLLVPAVYGGDDMVKEVAVGPCGLAASATALSQFGHIHAVWGNGTRRPSARAGSTPGASTLVESRGDGIDWAYVLNTRDWPPSTSPNLNDLGTSINQLLNTTSIV